MSSASSRDRYKPPQKLTVQGKSRVELANKKEKDNASIALCFFKWMCTFLLFCLILFCLVVSKVTLISIGHRLGPQERNRKKSCSSSRRSSSSKTTMSTKDSSVATQSFLARTKAVPTQGPSPQPSPSSLSDFEADVVYTMIMLVMMIPHLISFVRAFCRSAFSKIQLWPGRMSLLMVSSIL